MGGTNSTKSWSGEWCLWFRISETLTAVERKQNKKLTLPNSLCYWWVVSTLVSFNWHQSTWEIKRFLGTWAQGAFAGQTSKSLLKLAEGKNMPFQQRIFKCCTDECFPFRFKGSKMKTHGRDTAFKIKPEVEPVINFDHFPYLVVWFVSLSSDFFPLFIMIEFSRWNVNNI